MTPRLNSQNTNMLLVIHDLQLDLGVILNLLSPFSLSFALFFFFFFFRHVFMCVRAFERCAYYAPRAQLNILLTKTERGRD